MGQLASRFGAGSFSADSHEARASSLIERQCLQKECTNSIDQKHKRRNPKAGQDLQSSGMLQFRRNAMVNGFETFA